MHAELLRQLNGLVQSDVVADDAAGTCCIATPALALCLRSRLTLYAELIECPICCDEKRPSEIYTYYQCGHSYCTDVRSCSTRHAYATRHTLTSCIHSTETVPSGVLRDTHQ
jgi:hypothetical protein